MTIGHFAKKVWNHEWAHPQLTYPWFLLRVLACRLRYARTVARIRARKDGSPIRVAFLVSSTAKWKCQSLYDLMAASDRYEPFMALTLTDEDSVLDDRELQSKLDEDERFYSKFGNKCCRACDVATRKLQPLADLKPDIVFFQVPWGLSGGQTVWQVAKYALACYMPYSIENLDWKGRPQRFDFQHVANFHLLQYANFAWCDAHAQHYKRCQFPWEFAGKVLSFGHTTFDPYYLEGVGEGGEKIIYAPHFSFKYKEFTPLMRLSTFPQTGRAILEYAKAHPEMKWVFKPHPLLKGRLYDCGFMTRDEVEAYYAEWAKIGEVCCDGDYSRQFRESRAMVTDSSSFLTEYLAVGKPLIRLIPADLDTVPVPAAAETFDSFYNVRSMREMQETFRLVLENREDPLREKRLSAAKRVNVLGNYAAKRIVDWFDKTL